MPGADLDVGAQILSGQANAVPVWIRFAGISANPIKSAAEIGFETNVTLEYAK